jgi:hypothetical protein
MTANQRIRAAVYSDESTSALMEAPVYLRPAAPGPSSEIERRSNTLKLMIAASKAAGFAISADLRVGEPDAAELLGYSRKYLKELRQEGKGPVSYLRGIGGGRISYRLIDLVEWIEFAREDR